MSLPPVPLPALVNLESTLGCNLECVMCGSHLSGVTKQRRSMSAELLAKVEHEILGDAVDLSLTVAGEPFMTPKFGRFVELAERQGLWLQLNSNATLLKEGALLRRVLRQSTAIRFSVDGATRETYAAIRGADAFDKVCENIRMAVRLRQELPEGHRPRLALCMVLMKDNAHELVAMVDLAKALGVDQLEVAYLTALTPELDTKSLRHSPALANDVLDAAQARAAALAFQIVLPPRMDGRTPPWPVFIRARLLWRDLRRTRGNALRRKVRRLGHKLRLARWSVQAGGRVPCHFLQGAVFVSLAGDVAPCPMPGRPTAGNLYESTFEEIWNGAVLSRLRTGFLNGTPEPCCAHCSQNPARHDPTDADTAQPPGGLESVGVTA